MKSRLFFLGASISEAALPFARNLILARALSPSDFGVAVLVATIWSLSEVCLDLGLDRFVMRHPTVDTDQGGLATLQTIQLLRGLAIAAVIAVNAYVFADLMKAPDLFIPLLVVAASAVIRGLASLRAQVAARDGNFFPHASMILFAQLAWTLVTIVVALLMPSPIAMAWGIAAAHVVAALTSHLFALGQLRLGWSSEVAKEALRFGVPLVPNGMASAVIFMVDRLHVASFYGV
jgi:PST family polysaccharide transporter